MPPKLTATRKFRWVPTMDHELNSGQCILLLPEADLLSRLQRLRLPYDPLARQVPPHVTVVFLFALDGPGVKGD